MAILAGALLLAGRPLLGHRHAAWSTLAGIFLYTTLVGAEASVVRAAIMGSLFVLTHRLLGRPTFAPAALFLAAFFMTLANPHVLWQVGFQLSFAATLGLMLYATLHSRWSRALLERRFQQEWVRRFMPFLYETVLATLAAQVLTLPLLLTGDAEGYGERAILESGLPVRALVLKAGHHGSRTSSNAFFLEAVQPRIVVVSAGEDNQAGHPHPEMLQLAAAVGATVLRTDELGTIEVVTDGERMWWEAER